MVLRRRRQTAVAEPAARREADEEEIVEEVPPPPPPRIWPWLLLLLLLVIAGGAAWWFLTQQNDKTTMPSVIGLQEQAARARIAEAQLEADVDRRPSRRPRGTVFAQVPGAGKQLDEGERVEILVSSALIRVVVPNVRDLPEAQARDRLEQAGFEVRARRIFAGATKGNVVEQDPRGGERAERGSTVELLVSKGRNLKRVPDVIGLSENEAVQMLRAREFEPRIFDVPSTEAKGTVIAQVPRGGVLGPPDARVRINVSTGESTGTPTERTSTQPTTTGAARATVPSLVGAQQTPALRRLRSARLEGIVRYRTSSQPLGRVLAQQPAPGTRLASGGDVILTVSAGDTTERVAVPDVTGMTLAEARQTLQDEGFRVQTISVRTSDTPEGQVMDQQPAAGTRAPPDAIVTLFVASAD